MSTKISSPRPDQTGRFITFEGIDGAGKSTHIPWFAAALEQRLEARGLKLVVTREPGGTELGEALRALLLHHPMHLETEALLMFAARREHLAHVIEPALQRGDWVISDRFTDASFAYQGGGRGLGQNKLEVLEQWVHPALQPDKTLLFDVPVAIARERLSKAREADQFEQLDSDFFEKVRRTYLGRAQQMPHRFIMIDSTQSIDEIHLRLENILDHLLDENLVRI